MMLVLANQRAAQVLLLEDDGVNECTTRTEEYAVSKQETKEDDDRARGNILIMIWQ